MKLLHWMSFVGYLFDTVVSDRIGYGQSILEPLQPDAPQNNAAWIISPQAQLSISPAPFPLYDSDELVLKNHIVAVNPVDWKIQSTGGLFFNLSYPLILGEDVAGEIFKVGSDLEDKFKVGDRVIAHTMGLGKGSTYGGFQLYPILTAATTAKIPDELEFEDAAVLPLSISTAAAGLYLNTSLGLRYPQVDRKSSSNYDDGSTLLVWGGSSSVGSSVIQLAKAAGYTVVTTASLSNFKYCEDLGASKVFDYHDEAVVKNLIGFLKGKNVVGVYDAIGSDITVRQSALILHVLGGGKIASVGLAFDVFSDVIVSRISSGDIVKGKGEVANEIWGKYVPWALKYGRLVASPKALIVGRGLESVQKGLDRQKEGVSAEKVEILLV